MKVEKCEKSKKNITCIYLNMMDFWVERLQLLLAFCPVIDIKSRGSLITFISHHLPRALGFTKSFSNYYVFFFNWACYRDAHSVWKIQKRKWLLCCQCKNVMHLRLPDQLFSCEGNEYVFLILYPSKPITIGEEQKSANDPIVLISKTVLKCAGVQIVSTN